MNIKSFVIDYIDNQGTNRWQDVDVFIPRNQTVQAAVASVIHAFERRGHTVSCVSEPLNGYTHEQIEAMFKVDAEAARYNMRMHYVNMEVAARG